tara:strand:- start:1409 stop:2338 length:930 start_codon:yes stop_codon:yes gene_type:complete
MVGQIIGQMMANNQNQKLARNQRDWNDIQWGKQNTYNQSIKNRDNKYNEGRQAEQRDYDQSLWNQANKYNSPIEQMARLKEAGLNPHLMYGNGTVGNASPISSGQQNKSAGQQTPSVSGYSRSESRNVLQGINAFREIATLKNLNAQTNNVEVSTDNAKLDGTLKNQQWILNLLGIQKGTLDNEKAKELYDNSVDSAIADTQTKQQNLRKLTSQADVQIKTEGTQVATQKQQLKNLITSGKNLSAQQIITEWHAKLAKNGLSPNDPKWARVGSMLLDEIKKEETNTPGKPKIRMDVFPQLIKLFMNNLK